MAYEINENSGSLFKNEKKEKDTHPDYTGKANVMGILYYMSAWKKESSNGKQYLSFAFKPVQATQEPRASHTVELNDDLPF